MAGPAQCPLGPGLQATACVLCLVCLQRSQEAKFNLGGQGQVGSGPPFLLNSRVLAASPKLPVHPDVRAVLLCHWDRRPAPGPSWGAAQGSSASSCRQQL